MILFHLAGVLSWPSRAHAVALSDTGAHRRICSGQSLPQSRREIFSFEKSLVTVLVNKAACFRLASMLPQGQILIVTPAISTDPALIGIMSNINMYAYIANNHRSWVARTRNATLGCAAHIAAIENKAGGSPHTWYVILHLILLIYCPIQAMSI